MRNQVSFGGAAAPDFFAAPVNFQHPSGLLADPSLTVEERRPILAGWASDAHAVEDKPWLRQLKTGARIAVSEVLSAPRMLDG